METKVTRRFDQPFISTEKDYSIYYINSLGKVEVNITQVEEITTILQTKKKKRKGFLMGEFEDFFKLDLYEGMPLPGKIVIIESFSPPIPEDPEYLIKYNSDGSICRVDGKVVYKTEVYTDDIYTPDVFIS